MSADSLVEALLLAVLVVATINQYLLRQRLQVFDRERQKLEAFVKALDVTVGRAENAIRRLGQASRDEGNPQAAAEAYLRSTLGRRQPPQAAKAKAG